MFWAKSSSACFTNSKDKIIDCDGYRENSGITVKASSAHTECCVYADEFKAERIVGAAKESGSGETKDYE